MIRFEERATVRPLKHRASESAPALGRASGLPQGSTQRLAAGRELYREGHPAVAPYIVVSGILRVSVALIDGRERLVDIVGPGDVVGTAALEGAEHAETVVAADGGAVVSQIDLDLVLSNRSSRQRLTAALVDQLVRSRELADDLGLPMGARICRILARLAVRLGETEAAVSVGGKEGWRHLPFALTHDDVALFAGCARVTATRVMGDLKESGVLRGSRGDYALIPDALLSAADEYVCDVI